MVTSVKSAEEFEVGRIYSHTNGYYRWKVTRVDKENGKIIWVVAIPLGDYAGTKRGVGQDIGFKSPGWYKEWGVKDIKEVISS